MVYTKEDLANRFNLDPSEVRDTLKAVGLSLKRKSYIEQEIEERFAVARKLFDDGVVIFYDDISEYFRSQRAGRDVSQGGELDDESGNSLGGGQVASVIETLRKEAIAQGFRLGLEQARIIGEVVPYATILRLQQMIENGGVRSEFERIWKDIGLDGGKLPLVQEVKAHNAG